MDGECASCYQKGGIEAVVAQDLCSLVACSKVQIPRLYNVYREERGQGVTCFQDLLDNIFEPLFAVSVDPASDPKLHLFLQQLVGFDCVGT